LQVNETPAYLSHKKRFKKDKQLLIKIEETIQLLKQEKIHFKKIICKKDKNRYSIRVANTSYRILATIYDNTADLICVCTHQKYDRYNKNC